MGSVTNGPSIITPCWVDGSHPRLQKSLWPTGVEAVSVSVDHHLRQDGVEDVRRRASIFSSRAEVIYNDNGSVAVDVRQAIDTGILKTLRWYSRHRSDERWLVHTEMTYMTWLRDRSGHPFNLHCAGFEKDAQKTVRMLCHGLSFDEVLQILCQCSICQRRLSPRAGIFWFGPRGFN